MTSQAGLLTVQTVTETPGEALGRLIRETGRKKQWVAAELCTTPDRLGRIIQGTRALAALEAARLAEIFGVEITTFVPAREVGA